MVSSLSGTGLNPDRGRQACVELDESSYRSTRGALAICFKFNFTSRRVRASAHRLEVRRRKPRGKLLLFELGESGTNRRRVERQRRD